MKLYYTPGACSQAPHIVLHELGLSHDGERVDLRAKTTQGGRNYLEVNDKGSVPALELDSGEVLTENAVILQYLGDRSGLQQILPPLGDFRRYRVLEWLNFVATELHKGFAPLFSPATNQDGQTAAKQALAKKLAYVDQRLGAGPFLMGNTMTLPDAYLFVMLGWAENFGVERGANLTAFRERMMTRESVREALRTEGLLAEEPAG